jgi:hypothetical protein
VEVTVFSGSGQHRKSSAKIPFLLIAFLGLCLLSAGCSGFYFVGFVSNPGGTRTVIGTVSIVNLGFVQDVTGAKITFTAVTFVNSGTAITINFCGDQRGKFPLNSTVSATFTHGIFCSNLVSVVAIT